MPRLINTVAILAAVVVLAAGLWQDWGLLSTVKRMLISYLGFFFLGSLGTLLVVTAGLFEPERDREEMKPTAGKKEKEKVVQS